MRFDQRSAAPGLPVVVLALLFLGSATTSPLVQAQDVAVDSETQGAQPQAQSDPVARDQAPDQASDQVIGQERERGRSESPPNPDEHDEADETPTSSAAGKASPRRFVPSEQVRADFDVSFPIDI